MEYQYIQKDLEKIFFKSLILKRLWSPSIYNKPNIGSVRDLKFSRALKVSIVFSTWNYYMLHSLAVEARKSKSKPILIMGAESPQLQLACMQSEKLFVIVNHKLKKASLKINNLISKKNCYTILHKYHIFIRNSLLNKTLLLSNGLRDIFFNPNFLLFACSCLRNCKILFNITLAEIIKISMELKNNLYKFKPIHRVGVLKLNKNSCFLSIASLKDKVVQQALLLLLEPFFENIFENSSYGFRQKSNAHSCLTEIQKSWQGIVWFLEFDIKKIFNKTNHRQLIIKMKKYIKNKIVLNTIVRFLKAGYMNKVGLKCNWVFSQNSIISFFLLNIYMHEFDVWINNILTPRFTNVMTKLRDCKTLSLRILQNKKNAIHLLWYVRYADNFLLGYVGSKKDVSLIFYYIIFFLESILYLKINISKTNIKYYRYGIHFLGYRIVSYYKLDFFGNKYNARLKFKVPVKKLLLYYKNKGFFKLAKLGKNIKYVGRCVNEWFHLVKDVDVIRRFQWIIDNLFKYYRGSFARSALLQIFHLLKKSAMLTLANRHKLKVTWGYHLKVEYVNMQNKKVSIKLEIPSTAGGGKFNKKTKFNYLPMSLKDIPRTIILRKILNIIIKTNKF